MAEVKNVDTLLPLDDAVDYSVDVRLVAIEQMSKQLLLRCDRATVWTIAQGEDGFLQASVPSECSFAFAGVNL